MASKKDHFQVQRISRRNRNSSKNYSNRQPAISNKCMHFKTKTDSLELDNDDFDVDSSNEDTILELMVANEEMFPLHRKLGNSNNDTDLTDNKVERRQPFDHPKKHRENSYDMIETEKIGSRKSKPGQNIFLKRLIGKESKYVLIELTKSEVALKECIQKAKMNNEHIELFLEILAKAYECEMVPNAMIMLYETLKENDFFDTLSLFLIDLQDRLENPEHRIEHIKILKNILDIVVKQITINPFSAKFLSRVFKVLKQIFAEMKDDDGHALDKDIQIRFTILTERRKTAEKLLMSTSSSKDKLQPPEDFRLIQVTPSANEIQCAAQPFLRPNKLNGGYDDLDHYLDVQFRLLREDFVGPLREGISQYIKSNMGMQKGQQKTNSDIKIYNAKVYSPIITECGFCYQLKLEMTPRLRKTNWSVSKRLIYGSLLCLTNDDFATLTLATVVGRDEEDISRGLFTIQLDGGFHTTDFLHQSFKIAETSAYFESYKYVLKGLQAIKPGGMPFERYIVHCESKVDKPAYISTETVFDLSSLVDQNAKISNTRRLPDLDVTRKRDYMMQQSIPGAQSLKEASETAKAVKILDTHNWPDKETLNLDESQYAAVQTALTKEFSIIQGPPGTGKTYIGLKITKALLHNIHLWGESKVDKTVRPMLIVCYTNHALDQFLEGVYNFFKGDIVRVGGRSKSTILERCSLKAYRKSYAETNRAVQLQLKAELEQNSSNVSLWAKSLELYQSEIVHENYLFHEMSRRFYNNLVNRTRKRRKKSEGNLASIANWLGIAHIIEETKRQTKMKKNEKMFVSVDDEQSERRNKSLLEGMDENYKISGSETKLINKIRMSTIAFYVEDIIIPEDTNMNPELLAELDFRRSLKERLQVMIMAPEVMSREEADRIGNIWNMNFKDRWRLYRMWLRQLCNNIYSKIESKKMEFEAASERYRDFILEQEKEIMQNATVIGMTTSCAAKYQATLCEIEPKIVIVEEAAEVLEAHVVTTLSKGCQHLILIGDHKQLKPNPTVYKLAVKYKLNISLFERIVSNGIQFNTLKLQHRMRPEIAEIIRHIYPELKDHDIVKSYPDVKGISSNLYFIDHRHSEESNEDLRSYSNLHEALYITALCRYLLLQGYKRHQITVLTTYTGQLMCLRKQMPRDEFEGVRVTVVDNYQGEENDIVLLSLVRSNQDSKIGFLKIDNRICVALSRAKIGFYLMGNFTQLALNSNLWKSIVSDMRSQGKFGDQLKLYCQNHPNDDAIVAKEGKDFNKAPNGGCSKKCETRLNCGHVCPKFCHVEDKDHIQYECMKPCQKSICVDHRCPDYCFEVCRPCRVLVSKVVPNCGHEQMIECSLPPEKFICQMLCEAILACGHKCTQLCGEKHTKYCKEKVDRELRCGHTISTDCCQPVDDIECPESCQTLLKCGHLCKGTCGYCNCGRFHMRCNKACKRILVCGHECSDVCNNCQPCTAKCENRCVHSICQNSCGELCVPCLEPCEWRCQHFRCSQLCSEPCDRPRCDEPCDKLLQCGHPCMGFCGEPCAEFFCRVCDFEIVTEILFGNEDEPGARFVYLEDCGHNIESSAMDTYMDAQQDEEAIQLKGCPKCKTPIRKCLRYGSVIKENLHQIEMVKQANVKKTSLDKLQDELKKAIQSSPLREGRLSHLRLPGFGFGSLSGFGFGRNEENHDDDNITKISCLNLLKSRVSNDKSKLWTEVQIATIRNQLSIFEALDDISRKMKGMKSHSLESEKALLSFYSMLKLDILNERNSLTEQEIDDFQREIERGHDYNRALKLNETVIDLDNSDRVLESIRKIENILLKHERYTEDLQKCVRQEFDIIKDLTKIDGLEISGEERLEIVKALGLSKGHWFKCPNNHIYAIGECGGAMERGACPECKEEIGGNQHRLTDGNSLAPEMDGARFAAYSEEANNMANFDLNDL
ncbi:NFX1-type zinc finger-containing protein 1-like [Ruditapes philippinarum]|uniref:NFX1-type zinc finger-containing protein 1-like n=1 Tax=Ruditapes philippinarum TaxID=129788 RepID=UPI00295BE323|nr:NFX1-type zinc finger-containing protein 1-like [Ruditapes philippinarum]